ncbi:hypothetical protein K2173_028067 [Erythroxylum novogranatense]|uniref:Uncharacterized protein n=1 Tax=Erythroxylum novogranatense TaxID=1862640 RepID=A0AAV8U4G8_9ROSI|nr:hypothetical protein K2173_028067 [Erythroxylum novogranatense]
MGIDNIDNAKTGTGLLEKNLDMVTIMLEKDGIEVLAHIPIEEKGESISMEDTSPSLSKGPEPSQLNNSHTINDQELVGVTDLYCKEKHVIVDKGEESTNMEIVVGSVDRGWTDNGIVNPIDGKNFMSCEDPIVQLAIGNFKMVDCSEISPIKSPTGSGLGKCNVMQEPSNHKLFDKDNDSLGCEDSCMQLHVGASEVVTYSFLAEDETTSVIADVHISIGDVVTGDEDNGNQIVGVRIEQVVTHIFQRKTTLDNFSAENGENLDNITNESTLEHYRIEWANMLTPIATVGQIENQETRDIQQTEDCDTPLIIVHVLDISRDFCVQPKYARRKFARKRAQNPKDQKW